MNPPFDFCLPTANGLQLVGRTWEPERPTKGVVVLVHGLGEHGGRYSHVGEFFCKADYALVAVDLVGHGQSDGKRGHVESFERVYDDLELIIGESASQFPVRPVYLYGHSFGGNLSLSFTLKRRPAVSGVIASAPALAPGFAPPAWKVMVAKALNHITPGLTLSNELNLDHLCRDPAIVSAYKQDPLVHDRISIRLYNELMSAGEFIISHASEFPAPLFIHWGGGERLVSIPAIERLVDGASCEHRAWPDLYHELHNEPERDEVLAVALSWIESTRRESVSESLEA